MEITPEEVKNVCPLRVKFPYLNPLTPKNHNWIAPNQRMVQSIMKFKGLMSFKYPNMQEQFP